MNIVEGEINMLFTAPDSPNSSVSSPAAGEVTDQPVAPVDEMMEDKVTIQITSENTKDKMEESGVTNGESETKETIGNNVEEAELVSAKVEPVMAREEKNNNNGTIAIAGIVVVVLIAAITLIAHKQKGIKK